VKGAKPVSYWTLYRLGGGAAALGGALLLITDISRLFATPLEGASRPGALGSSWQWSGALFVLGLGLALLGLASLYAYQARDVGVPGLVGFVAAFLGTALSIGTALGRPLIAPSLFVQAQDLAAELLAGRPGALISVLMLLLALAGWAVFGAATLRARVFPRAPAITVVVGAVLAFLAFVGLPGTLVLDAGVAWIGLALLTRRSEGSSSRPIHPTA
jgi:hypothetical protein